MPARRARSASRPARRADRAVVRDRPPVFGSRYGETPITPFLVVYYSLSLVAVAAGWLKGGHPERLGATATLVAFAVSWFTHPWRIGTFYVGDAVLDLATTAFFAWLALRTDRWWPLVMTGIMILTLLVHASGLLIPHLGGYADISARIGLGILGALILSGGVVERWLAGEKAVSDSRAWARVNPSESPASRRS